jgi:hypothetical protein
MSSVRLNVKDRRILNYEFEAEYEILPEIKQQKRLINASCK